MQEGLFTSAYEILQLNDRYTRGANLSSTSNRDLMVPTSIFPGFDIDGREAGWMKSGSIDRW